MMKTLEFDDNGLPLSGRELDVPSIGDDLRWRHAELERGNPRLGGWIAMHLDSNGLPHPGRVLDAWIAENVFERDPLGARVGLHKNGDLEYHWGYPWGHAPAKEFSTTHAYHSVMEAMETRDYFIDLLYHPTGLLVRVRRLGELLGPDHLAFERVFSRVQNPSFEKLTAHAVCAAAWKAMGGKP